MKLNKEDIIKEGKEIIPYYLYKKAMNSGIEKSVIKIIREKKVDNELKFISGSGFFCKIPSKNLKVLFTNNHILDKTFLDNEKKLIYIIDKGIEEEEREINLELERYKYTNEDLDFTLIEIIEEDEIIDFLEIDKYINSKNYKDELIFSVQFPGGKRIHISNGKILDKEDDSFLYNLGTESGSSGSPILLIDNAKLIGMHQGKHKTKRDINLGIPFNLIINAISYVKPIYYISILDLDKKGNQLF